jgi:hypothetical protein
MPRQEGNRQFDLMKIGYQDLTTNLVEQLSAQDAEIYAYALLADLATVKEGGIILSWPQFNENPNIELNRLLARIMVSRMDEKLFDGKNAQEIAILSIENSAPYLSGAIAMEVQRRFALDRAPRVIRARKTLPNKVPSPAMGEHTFWEQVQPITAGGETRTLVASYTDEDDDLKKVNTLIISDDFGATFSTLKGAVKLGIRMLSELQGDACDITIIPTSALTKPEQATQSIDHGTNAYVSEVVSALAVHFWPDYEMGHVMISVNGFEPKAMKKASITRFPKGDQS